MRKPKTADIADTRTEGVRDVPLTEIDIPEDRARSFEAGEAEGLAVIIAASGLQHPIRVRPVGNRFRLIAGRKRLEAFRLLEWETIPATISTASNDDEARLEEVMENLGRVELKTLDRCQHLFELKQVHERLYPETKHGGDRKSEIKTQKLRFDPDREEVFGFAAATAEKIGLSRRTIEIAVKIWTDLTPDSRLRCAGTRLADHQSGLKELSDRSPADQAKILDMLLADPPVAVTVSEAAAILANGVALTPMEKKVATVRKALHALPEPVASSLEASAIDARLGELQKSIATLSKFFGGLKDDELDRVIADHEERIIASLKRRGRI